MVSGLIKIVPPYANIHTYAWVRGQRSAIVWPYYAPDTKAGNPAETPRAERLWNKVFTPFVEKTV